MVSADAGDGSCWVADLDHHQVVHLGEDGRELWRGGGDGGLLRPIDISANSTDVPCWVIYQGDIDTGTGAWVGKALLHLDRDGTELWRTTSFLTPYAIAVDPSDGSCWVADEYNLIHLSADGQELWSGAGFWEAGDIVVDGRDSSCWVADSLHDRVVHVGVDGQILAQSSFADLVIGVSLNPADGTLWVLELSPGPPGQEGRFILPPTGASCGGEGVSMTLSPWPSAPSTGRAGSLTATMAASLTSLPAGWNSRRQAASSTLGPDIGARRMPLASTPVTAHVGWRTSRQRDTARWCTCPSVDGTLAARGHSSPGGGERGLGRWLLLDRLGRVPGRCRSACVRHAYTHRCRGQGFWRGGEGHHPWSVEADPTDGSCWVADEGLWDAGAGDFVESGVYHIAADGTEVWSGGNFSGPFSISVSPSDGSCWVSDTYHDQVVRLAADGTELWRMGGFSMPNSIAVNPTDSTAWVADCYSHQIVHLGADGKDLFRGDAFLYPHAIAVNWKDGSVWVGVNNVGPLMHFAADGSLLWRAWGSFSNGDIAVNQADGSVWSVDDYDMQLVHYVHPRFADVPFEQWAYTEIDAVPKPALSPAIPMAPTSRACPSPGSNGRLHLAGPRGRGRRGADWPGGSGLPGCAD